MSAPSEWLNFDVSPTLRMQRIPVLGALFRGMMRTKWPTAVRYGDITRGLPLSAGSCKGLYCSHVLEHLALDDFRKALKNSHALLSTDGVFRLVVPDLRGIVEGYNRATAEGNPEAAVRLVRFTLMGIEQETRGLGGFVREYFGNARHKWMWDEPSMRMELEKAGFTRIRRCEFGDAGDPMFRHVEDESRFRAALAMEACK